MADAANPAGAGQRGQGLMDVGLAKTGHEIGLGERPTPPASVNS
jgi:hypothetical protein